MARRRLPRLAWHSVVATAFLGSLVACGPQGTPTFFIPPTDAAPPPPVVSATADPAVGSTPTSAAVPTILPPTPTPPCSDGLSYVQDLTVPDGSNFAPGQPIDKQWLVTNSGTCNWDSRYRLKLIGGDAMGVPSLLPLYPARAGSQATIRIVFSAPQQAGLYQSQWQAMNPDGATFGDAFFVQIAVAP